MKKNISWRFWIQLIPLVLLIFWLWYVNNYMESLAIYGGAIAFLSALSIGITGLRWHDEENSLYKATKVLAVINLWIAGLAVASFLLYLIMPFV